MITVVEIIFSTFLYIYSFGHVCSFNLFSFIFKYNFDNLVLSL